MSNNMGIFLFVFLIVVFILLLTGGRIIKYMRSARLKAKREALNQEQKYRDETGRQQRQYHYSGPKNTGNQEAKPRSEEEAPEVEESKVEEIHTKTATGETIIDRRAERESKKIYDDSDGEYVEFSEE